MNARGGRRTNNGGKPTQGEIIPPEKLDPNGLPSVYADIAAQITHYTDRPDLLLEVIEKHDPGFIKGMNEEAREFSKTYRESRFRFGRFQSYASAIIAFIVALVIVFIIYSLAMKGDLTAWHLVGFAIFYAVTQSGPSGFMKVVSQIVGIVKGVNGK